MPSISIGIDERELAGAAPRRRAALLERRVLADDDAFLLVRAGLPAVLGVRLRDVDDVERGAIRERLVHRLQVAGPATKRRSGVAAEEQDERARGVELPDRDRRSERRADAGAGSGARSPIASESG